MSIVTRLQFQKRPKPAKISGLMKVIRHHLDEGRYLDTRHASQRGRERGITRPEILQVLRCGHHEKSRDRFDETHRAWNYAVKGKTVDLRSLRIIVSLDPAGMLIITAIDLEK
ncbi:MAG: DUF4258 domain-containing protein [Bdellovibrionales bacterium]|nr:DUF4258 domain-containing protein [Bdellovibrionales bacterium]